jgi:hypothetical protein
MHSFFEWLWRWGCLVVGIGVVYMLVKISGSLAAIAETLH